MGATELDGRILILAPTGRDGAALAQVVAKCASAVEILRDGEELAGAIEAGAAAVLIAEEGLFGHDLKALRDWVQSQPAWSDLPFVVLTSRQEEQAVAAWRLKLTADLRNVSLLERPVQTLTLLSAVKAAMRARGRQYEVRELLAARDRAAQELEALVETRTAALAAANAELRRQMIERARMEAALHQAQKLEALGQLTGGVAHDFNNLLMVIIGGLEVLEHQRDPVRRGRILDGMRHAADRGAGLTRQLLAFSRRSALRPEPIDLAQRIAGMQEMLDRSLRGDVQVGLELDADLWPVEVDPGELELVMLNLAVNARDAMPEGGAIVIRACNVAGPPEATPPQDHVRLSVCDTGTGMPPEVMARVFEPFYTTKEMGRGSGLGLPQVHGFAKQSGGAVEIESEPGVGTTVSLLLPRTRQDPAALTAPAREAGAARPPTAAAEVLLVEDDDEVAALVTEMFEHLGYGVTRTASAAAALGALADGRSIDLVFSDVMMPGGMNGVELAREIHNRRRGLPILLASAYAQSARDDAEAAGVRLLAKPFGLEDLAGALAGALPPSLKPAARA